MAADSETEESEEEYGDHDLEHTAHGTSEPSEGTVTSSQEEAAFWIPQATPDGRLFYFNTLTGESTMELPLEAPTSANETGPRDRTNIYIPDQTRPPAELMAAGYERDEETDYSETEDTSVSQSKSSGVSRTVYPACTCRVVPSSEPLLTYNPVCSTGGAVRTFPKGSHRPRPWIRCNRHLAARTQILLKQAQQHLSQPCIKVSRQLVPP